MPWFTLKSMPSMDLSEVECFGELCSDVSLVRMAGSFWPPRELELAGTWLPALWFPFLDISLKLRALRRSIGA